VRRSQCNTSRAPIGCAVCVRPAAASRRGPAVAILRGPQPVAQGSAMPSFDIVSKTDLHEVDNAIENLRREIGQRFDFKGSKCSIERQENAITILADDNPKLGQMQELLRGHVTRRKLDASVLDFGTPERAGGDMIRQIVTVKQGIDRDLSKQIVKALKDSKLKVQASIQG